MPYLIISHILIALLTIVCVPWAPAEAADRIALVVGNSKYQNTATLANPTSDARKIAASLKKIGFGRVDLKFDVTFAQLRRDLRDLNAEALNAEMALVCFDGH